MKFIGTLIDPSGKDLHTGGYYCSPEIVDFLRYHILYEPDFIGPDKE
jgi:hypothetical protein